MHLETLKPFDTEECMLAAVVGLKKKDGHALRQFPTYPARTCSSVFLSSIYISSGPDLPFSPSNCCICLTLLKFSSAQQTLPAGWSWVRCSPGTEGSRMRKHVVPPLQNLLPLGRIIWVIVIILGLYWHNQTITRAMGSHSITGCVGTGKGTGHSTRGRGVRDREGDVWNHSSLQRGQHGESRKYSSTTYERWIINKKLCGKTP